MGGSSECHLGRHQEGLTGSSRNDITQGQTHSRQNEQDVRDRSVFRERSRIEASFEEERGGRKMSWDDFRKGQNKKPRLIRRKWKSIKCYLIVILYQRHSLSEYVSSTFFFFNLVMAAKSGLEKGSGLSDEEMGLFIQSVI